MDKAIQTLQQTLHQHGYSMTQPRNMVFKVLVRRHPVSMRELVAECGDTDRASVYRTVALYEKLGIVKRVYIGWKYMLELGEAYAHHHHHATCAQCGMVLELPESVEFEKLLQNMAQQQAFTIQGHQVELIGVCSNCNA